MFFNSPYVQNNGPVWSSLSNSQTFSREAINYLGCEFLLDIEKNTEVVPTMFDIYATVSLCTAETREKTSFFIGVIFFCDSKKNICFVYYLVKRTILAEVKFSFLQELLKGNFHSKNFTLSPILQTILMIGRHHFQCQELGSISLSLMMIMRSRGEMKIFLNLLQFHICHS